MIYPNHSLNRTWKCQRDTSPVSWVTWASGLIDSYQYTLTGPWRSCTWKKARVTERNPTPLSLWLTFPHISLLTGKGRTCQQEASHCCPVTGANSSGYNEASGIWERERSFRFPFNANVSICLWIEVGSQMPIPGERIKCLKNKSPPHLPSCCRPPWGWGAPSTEKHRHCLFICTV